MYVCMYFLMMFFILSLQSMSIRSSRGSQLSHGRGEKHTLLGMKRSLQVLAAMAVCEGGSIYMWNTQWIAHTCYVCMCSYIFCMYCMLVLNRYFDFFQDLVYLVEELCKSLQYAEKKHPNTRYPHLCHCCSVWTVYGSLALFFRYSIVLFFFHFWAQE